MSYIIEIEAKQGRECVVVVVGSLSLQFKNILRDIIVQ